MAPWPWLRNVPTSHDEGAEPACSIRDTENTLAPLPPAATSSRPFGLTAIPSKDPSEAGPIRSGATPPLVEIEYSLIPLASFMGFDPDEGAEELINESTNA
jgi:hypothetical protein